MSTVEPLAASPLDGFVGSFTPPRVTVLYTCGLAAAAMAMLLLPIVYLLMIGALAYALLWYAAFAFPSDSPNFITLALYASPLLAGVILVFFTLKPFLSERAQAHPHLTLDPDRERLLVALVERLCAVLHAPRPSRIDVDLRPNASASLDGGVRSLVRRKVVLTIGLPLVAGLNTSELAGVLAHELSHFGQGVAMRLNYVISSINLWFARVAFERDKWDVWLKKSTNVDPRLAVAMMLARLSVAVTRVILKALFWIGHAISCFLLRQMEYDADRCQTLICGSDAFESCSRRIHGMTLAVQMVGPELQRAWARRALPDDVPYLVAQRLRRAGSLIDRFVEEAASRPTRVFDTHPTIGDRILAARTLHTQGVFRDDRPASDLFSNFTELSQRATRQLYEQQNNLSLDGISLVPSEVLLAGAEEGDRQHQALVGFFEGTAFPISPMPLPPSRDTRSTEDLLRQLVEARTRMRRERARSKDAMRRYEGTGVRLLNLTVARHLSALGMPLSQLPVHLRLEDVEKVGVAEAIARTRTRTASERDALALELAGFERAAVDRIEAALALMPHMPEPLIGADAKTRLDEVVRIAVFLNALDATQHSMRELQAGAFALNVLESRAPTQADAAAVKTQISQLHDDLMPVLRAVVARAGDLPHPLAGVGAGSVAAHLCGEGELTVPFALPRLLSLSDSCFVRVIDIVMAVEGAWDRK